jgi:hypothetical protein
MTYDPLKNMIWTPRSSSLSLTSLVILIVGLLLLTENNGGRSVLASSSNTCNNNQHDDNNENTDHTCDEILSDIIDNDDNFKPLL